MFASYTFSLTIKYFIEVLYYESKQFLSPADCDDLNDPDFGRVSVTGLVLGSVATYMCNPGYTLVGNMTRDCVQVDSTTSDWSDKAPVCTRMLKFLSFHIF